jgi:hypothetical protein
MFLVGDAPPHSQHRQRTLAAVDGLRRAGVSIFPVAASGAADEAEFILRAAAFLTSSRYLFLTDHSGIGNPHATPHVPQFNVERLDQLMVRMIAWKLSGKAEIPTDVISTASTPPAYMPATQTPQPIAWSWRPQTPYRGIVLSWSARCALLALLIAAVFYIDWRRERVHGRDAGRESQMPA